MPGAGCTMPRLKITDLPKSPDLHFETPLWTKGLTAVAGLDEAGRGAWAGPVSAAVVVLPPGEQNLKLLAGVRDSKKMTSRQRSFWAEVIHGTVSAWGVGFAEAGEVDEMGIVPATRLAMERALKACGCEVQHLLVDALRLPQVNLPQDALIKGDMRSLSIAAASVLAKTARDDLMRQWDASFPGYGFLHNKGYGTAVHRAALQSLGPCELHRRSFAPVRARLALL